MSNITQEALRVSKFEGYGRELTLTGTLKVMFTAEGVQSPATIEEGEELCARLRSIGVDSRYYLDLSGADPSAALDLTDSATAAFISGDIEFTEADVGEEFECFVRMHSEEGVPVVFGAAEPAPN